MRRLAAAFLGLAAGVALSGCGTGPTTIGASGIDGLTIPTPMPDPQDFVADIDNPWWPLQPHTASVFVDEGGRQFLRSVGEARVVAGVRAVPVTVSVVENTWTAGEIPEPYTEVYSQDRDGNVWLVGGSLPGGGEWAVASEASAGNADGADGGGPGAGLVVSAVPRVGDGYVRQVPDGDGASGWRSEVLEVDAAFDLAGEELETVVLAETRISAGDVIEAQRDEDREVELARGVGPVRITVLSGGFRGTWQVESLPARADAPTDG